MSDVKMEMKDMTRDICSIMDKLATGMLGDVSNPQNVSVDEMMSVADMIKDLAEAKEKLLKGKYYETIVCAMEEEGNKYGEDYNENGPMGYRGRDRRTGRYISRGYPMYRYNDKMMDDNMDYNHRMGYRNDKSMGRNMGNEPSRHGEAYDRYQMARRYYTENPTGEMKMQMNNSWDEAVDDAIQAIKKMYMDAEAPQRTKVMEKMQKAINEMPN